MKLLEDMPSAVAHRPPARRTGLMVTVIIASLLAAAVVGAYFLTQNGGRPVASAAGDAAQSGTDVTMADWAEAAAAACTRVVAEHPILGQAPTARVDAANLTSVEDGTRLLTAAIRELLLPADTVAGAKVTTVVAAGDRADQAWYALSATSTEVTTAQLTEASGLLTAFVTGLTGLGADCAPLK